MGIAAWLILGTVAGYVAGQMVRGDEGLGTVGHVLLGIVGALVGGFLADPLVGTDPVAGMDVRSMIVATIGAVVAIVVWDTMTEPVGRREPSRLSPNQARSQLLGRVSSRPSGRVSAPRVASPRLPSPRAGRRPV
jgi:uncharacterized membrane protein YeaQ/YmgE (transglycosylase-associated protein family)